jgi:hypothetical protein
MGRMPIVRLPLYGQLKQHVSFSELGLFNECQWKWVLRKVFETPAPEEKSFQMDFGKAIHSAMEVLFGPNGGDVEAAARHALVQYVDALTPYAHTMHSSDLTEALRIKVLIPQMVRDTLSCPDLQGIRTLRSELNIYEPILRDDGLEVFFKGFIDIIFVKRMKTKTVIYIADFKTCQWGWPAEKFRDIRVIAQVLLYKHFFCKITGANPKDVHAAFILLKKRPRRTSKKGEVPEIFDVSVEVEKISSGPKGILGALEYLQQTIRLMHTYTYEKNFEACERRWIDSETKEERSVRCPYMGTESCTGSAR